MASDPFLIIAATLGSMGPTIAGLAAWNATRQNASQGSVNVVADDVKELHDCLDRHTREFSRHTEVDEENFKKINRRLTDADADRLVFHGVLGHIQKTLEEQNAEALTVAAALAAKAEETATTLAEHDREPDGYRTTPDPPPQSNEC